MFLAIETSTKLFSVSVGNKDNIIGEIFLNCGLKHSDILHKYIDILLKETGIRLIDLKKIICSIGPGSFTGIRIGLTTAKTFSQLLNIPLVGISTIDIFAKNIVLNSLCNNINTKFYICPLIDALHEEVYAGIYMSYDKKISKIGNYGLFNIEKFLNKVTKFKNVVFTGDGALVYSEKIKNSFKNKKINYKILKLYPKASDLIFVSSSLKPSFYENVNPLYIKPPKIR